MDALDDAFVCLENENSPRLFAVFEKYKSTPLNQESRLNLDHLSIFMNPKTPYHTTAKSED